jgi:exosortase J
MPIPLTRALVPPAAGYFPDSRAPEAELLRPAPKPGWTALMPRTVVVLATLCAAAGLLTIWPSVQSLFNIWTNDDLKSMGMVVPVVSYLLILRAWRQMDWEANGSWWGFAILAISAAMMFLRDQMLLIVTINKNWLLQLPPLPLVAVVYAAGIVLLFGGPRLLKAAWFPVLFLWAVIPVPQTFSRMVDLPLQHASATVARAWAHALGQPLTQDKLRLMFTPEFGMFIAPGCNGIRGAITLGLAAVVVSYVYRFRWYICAPVVVGAVLLGYLFNFLRLCLLVVYYEIALPYPWLQDRAKNADFVIGGCLFLCALAIFFTVANKLRNDLPSSATGELSSSIEPAPAADPIVSTERPASLWPARSSLLLRVGAVLALAAIFGVDVLHEHRVYAAHEASQPFPQLPRQMGNFTLQRTWKESQLGVLVYVWGDYAAPSTNGTPSAHVMLGISPQTVHDAEVCHIARGEEPTWHGQITAATAGGPVELTAATYNDGATQKLEASTVCDNGSCRQYSGTSQHVTVVYARPHRGVPLEGDTTRPIPVMLKVESLDVLTPTHVMEAQMAATLTDFLKGADLLSATAAYSKR